MGASINHFGSAGFKQPKVENLLVVRLKLIEYSLVAPGGLAKVRTVVLICKIPRGPPVKVDGREGCRVVTNIKDILTAVVLYDLHGNVFGILVAIQPGGRITAIINYKTSSINALPSFNIFDLLL